MLLLPNTESSSMRHIVKRTLPAGKMPGGMRPCLVRFDFRDLADELQMQTQGRPGKLAESPGTKRAGGLMNHFSQA